MKEVSAQYEHFACVYYCGIRIRIFPIFLVFEGFFLYLRIATKKYRLGYMEEFREKKKNQHIIIHNTNSERASDTHTHTTIGIYIIDTQYKHKAKREHNTTQHNTGSSGGKKRNP